MKKIAVVEDNPANRLLVRAFLQDAYEVSEHETGASALRAFEKARPDLILLDLSLPEMDGLQVLACLKARPDLRGIPVSAPIAHAMVEERDRFLREGFDEYVSKLITDEKVVLDAIEHLISRDG